MGIRLGENRYGKAETRVLRVVRDAPSGRHELVDLNVSIALSGDLADVHLRGDNAAVLTTDTQKNTVYAFAQEFGVGSPEEFALRLARHFVGSQRSIDTARVQVQQYPWQRLDVAGVPAPRSFRRDGGEVRTTTVVCGPAGDSVVSGLRDLVLLNTTGSEFHGFVTDRYTTLAETRERILATAVDARWRYAPGSDGVAWHDAHRAVRQAMLEAFAVTHSLSLQQTLYAMGRRALEQVPQVAEVRLVLPNRHHFLVDLAPVGQRNDDEVYLPADRPYGLIEGTVLRDDVPADERAW